MVGRANVLVVDDDEAIRDVVAEVLRDEGYSVVCAENGAQALQEINADRRPDLVLLDLMMPVMSGWELLDAVHDDAELSRIPVVVLSAVRAPGTMTHLAKPVSLEELVRTLERGKELSHYDRLCSIGFECMVLGSLLGFRKRQRLPSIITSIQAGQRHARM